MTEDFVKDQTKFIIERNEILRKLCEVKSLLDYQGCHSAVLENKLQEAIMWLELDIKNHQSVIDFQKQNIGAL